MRKLSLLIFYQDYQNFLEELRDKGVVHIHENRKRSAEDEELKHQSVIAKRIGEMIKRLGRCVPEGAVVDAGLQERWNRAGEASDKLALLQEVFYGDRTAPGTEGACALDVLDFLEGQFKRMEQIEQHILSLEKDGMIYGPWGELPVERMKAIASAGWDMRFFMTPDRKYLPEWEDSYNAFVVNQERGQKYFVTVLPKGTEAHPDADAVVFPGQSLKEINAQVEALQAEKTGVADNLGRLAGIATGWLQEQRLKTGEAADLIKVNDASESLLEDKVIALEGWVPERIAAETGSWLAGKGVAYEISEPALEDNPPILLKNNPFARLCEFIGELYSLPSYRELDLTPFFAPFFVMFFGFCLGDAGYGLLILLGLTACKMKARPEMRPVLSLGQWLGLSTVIMGTVSGTFFGIPLLDVHVPWVEKLHAVMLDSSQLFNLSLVIGAVQIIFGMFLKVANLWKQYGFAAALSTIGWLVIILGGGACYLLQSQGHDTTVLMYAVLGLGGLLVFVLNNLKRNVFINVGAGLWDSYNMVTGLLGDTLSYIRLFALGISSSVLGLVFNDLAMNMSPDIPVIKQVVMLVILVFGHGVNLFMAGLGSFVHPMRLTFVEFYKNAGFEGGGRKYQPFRRRV